MHIIAGKARGRILVSPKGLDTRPITSRIKESLFNIWQTRIVDARFLDLFAGSGSVGIEALSRGAESAVFVEQNPEAVNVIKMNLAICQFTDGYAIYQDDVFRRIHRFKENRSVFDLIYLDPPFTTDEILLPVMEILSDASILADRGYIAIRTKEDKELPYRIGNLRKYRIKNYGISNVHFYVRH